MWASAATCLSVMVNTVADAARNPYLITNNENRGLLMMWGFVLAIGLLGSSALGVVFERTLIPPHRSVARQTVLWTALSGGAICLTALLRRILSVHISSLPAFGLIVILAVMAVVFAVTAWTVAIGSVMGSRTPGVRIIIWVVVSVAISHAVWWMVGAASNAVGRL